VTVAEALSYVGPRIDAVSGPRAAGQPVWTAWTEADERAVSRLLGEVEQRGGAMPVTMARLWTRALDARLHGRTVLWDARDVATVRELLHALA